MTRELSDSRFRSLHVDIVGPLLVSNGIQYLFTIFVRLTCWPEAVPLPHCKQRLDSRHSFDTGFRILESLTK